MKKLGCVNAAITCTLQDARGNVLGTTIDTPNAIAYAMAKNKNIARAVAHYQYFGDTITERAQLQDRFSWVLKETNLGEHLRWAAS